MIPSLPIVKLGSIGRYVKLLQMDLNELALILNAKGYPVGYLDGWLGTITTNGEKKFKKITIFILPELSIQEQDNDCLILIRRTSNINYS